MPLRSIPSFLAILNPSSTQICSNHYNQNVKHLDGQIRQPRLENSVDQIGWVLCNGTLRSLRKIVSDHPTGHVVRYVRRTVPAQNLHDIDMSSIFHQHLPTLIVEPIIPAINPVLIPRVRSVMLDRTKFLERKEGRNSHAQ